MKLHPIAGFVVKTRTPNGEKCFINLCSDEQVPPPDTLDPADIVLRIQQSTDWVVPIVVSPERADKDKAGNPSRVWDCCMNPAVLNIGVIESGIKLLTIETCLELVEDAAGIQLDRQYTIPKMKSKGALNETEVSSESFHKPKTLEDMLSSAVSEPKVPQPKSAGVLIEELSETKSDFNLNVYRGPYFGEGPKPSHCLELSGSHSDLSYSGRVIFYDDQSVNVGFKISNIEAIYTKDDDTLHIFLWN